MKPLRVQWFSSVKGTVGIAMCEDDFGNISYRLSAIDGFNENVDVNHIAAWGARFPNNAGDVLFGVGKDEKDRAPKLARKPRGTKRVSTLED